MTDSAPTDTDTGSGRGDRLLRRYGSALVQVFGTPQLVIASGHGCWVTDVDGKRYLDLLSGIAVNALGHGHPALVQAVTKQAESAIHVSNFFTSEPAIQLAERLLTISRAPDGSGVFFANSGTEATEAAIKLSRRTGRTRIVALEGSFHGRSTGALALTHKAAYREPFEPLIPEVVFVAPDDADALRAAVDDTTAALVVEPIQGEAGVRELSDDYLRLARELTTRHGALLVVDEIQTGIGRTGDWFAHQRAGIVPDAMTLAKGLGGGVPIGALVTFGPDVTGLLVAGQHGTTFGGNPLACAAGLAVLDTIERDDLLTHVREVGALLDDVTDRRRRRHPRPGTAARRSSSTAYRRRRSWPRPGRPASSSTPSPRRRSGSRRRSSSPRRSCAASSTRCPPSSSAAREASA